LNEEIKASGKNFERAYLIGVQSHRQSREEVEDHLRELESLVDTMGAEVVATDLVRVQRPGAQFLIGTGKAEEIATRVEALECDLVVFDDDLSPSQQHNWETKAKVATIDRRKVIIDIFARRARSHEARLQIELATLEYMLPRLKGAWTHLERQRGGTGQRGGAGELQIEVDRRIIRDRIAKLREEIRDVREHRANQRKKRATVPIPGAAIVGYTNTGKSTLLSAMTNAGVLAENKLFATLDATTRRVELSTNQPLLLTDTVGFIRKLPTTLVDAFKSTLEESVEADFLLHVVDASHPRAREQYEVTNAVLDELGALRKPTILVLNKFDRVDPNGPDPARQFDDFDGKVVRTSMTQGIGLVELGAALASFMGDSLADVHLRIPPSRFDIVSAVHRDGEVLEEKYDEDNVLMHALYPRRHLSRIEAFETKPW